MFMIPNCAGVHLVSFPCSVDWYCVSCKHHIPVEEITQIDYMVAVKNSTVSNILTIRVSLVFQYIEGF